MVAVSQAFFIFYYIFFIQIYSLKYFFFNFTFFHIHPLNFSKDKTWLVSNKKKWNLWENKSVYIITPEKKGGSCQISTIYVSLPYELEAGYCSGSKSRPRVGVWTIHIRKISGGSKKTKFFLGLMYVHISNRGKFSIPTIFQTLIRGRSPPWLVATPVKIQYFKNTQIRKKGWIKKTQSKKKYLPFYQHPVWCSKFTIFFLQFLFFLNLI